MKIKFALIALLWTLFAGLTQVALADSNSKVSNYDTEIEDYFKNQKIKPQRGDVEHSKHGRMAATSAPYSLDYTQCQNKVFSEKGFTFGNLTVSDPVKLKQFSIDFHVNLMAHQLADAKERKEMINQLFYYPGFYENHEKIVPLIQKTVACVKDMGWSYVKSKK